jgi:hypothetical protein
MSVLIDRYVLNLENSPKVLIYDKKLERVICSVNTLDRKNNVALGNILLDELNTGRYEEDSS